MFHQTHCLKFGMYNQFKTESRTVELGNCYLCDGHNMQQLSQYICRFFSPIVV